MASPIADLSYRNYDGPLLPPANRWWAIAKLSIQMASKKKGFWIWSALSSYWYLILIIILYVIDLVTPLQPGQKNPVLSSFVWKDQFLNAFSLAQLLYFIIALLIGLGTIANDNRANALLVYLSKPCSKIDYIIGKWLGIFIPLTLVTLVPTLLFYLYGIMSYRQYGFFSSDPWLFFKLLAMCCVPGAIHASLALGISSLFNQGRLAGAAYAGLYFIPYFITVAMKILINVGSARGSDVPPLAYKIFYASIDGLQIGLAKVILRTDGSAPFAGFNNNPNRRGFQATIPMPDGPTIFLIALIVCAIGIGIAWRRVRAVEVVG
jgi:ABC-2 type transport system permease protein